MGVLHPPRTVLGLPLDLSRAELTTIRRQWVRNSLVASNLFPVRWRGPALRRLGVSIGTAKVLDHCYFGSPRVSIGDGTYVNTSVFFDAGGRIEVGPRCAIGMRVTILTTTHELGGPAKRNGPNLNLTTRIGAGCWIGAAAMIMPGVSVGDGCIVAAGAVVTKDCEPHGLYAGVPATRVRDLPVDVPVTAASR